MQNTINKNDIKKVDSIHEGIVLKTNDYKESSKLVFLFTKEGLISFEAKGANKMNSKNNTYTLPITKVSVHTRGHFITSGKVIENYSNIKLEIPKYKVAVPLLEMSTTLADHITDVALYYEFLSSILFAINNDSNESLYSLIFRIKALYLFGIAPVLGKCVKCETRKNLIGFDLESGGMKCNQCSGSHLFTGHFIELFRTLYLTKLDQIKLEEIKQEYTEEDFSNLEHLLSDYYEKYLGYISKSKKIFEQIE